jgi:DNA replication ATP-dependent helicase Dna2
MSVIDRQSHAAFYEKELEILELEYKSYFYSEARALRTQGRLFVGLFQGFDEKRGNIIVKCRAGATPRLKQYYTCFTLPPELSKPAQWGELTYEGLRNQAIIGSPMLPLFYMKSDNSNFILIGCSEIEVSFAERLKHDTLIVIAENEPPYEYLKNLKTIVESVPKHSAAGRILDIETNSETWSPDLITGEIDLPNKVITHLKDHDEIIIQGPPGTGKTYLMAQITAQLCAQNKSVLVTALTNRALGELAEKQHLDSLLLEGKVWKTRLNLDEKKRIPKLQPAKEITAMKGHLVLTTFYQMSKLAVDLPNEPLFDYVILEEASQSFLATIAACKLLARKLIIIGDPMQLTPIYQQPHPEKIHLRLNKVINGLETYAYNSKTYALCLTETYRLLPRAARQTGIFYNDSLVSKSTIPLPLKIDSSYKNLFNTEGGTSVHYLKIANEGKSPISAINLIANIVQDIRQKNPTFSIAVLSPYVESAKRLQEKIYPLFSNLEGLTVETVDRIQGLTCDVTLFLIPFGSAFALQTNRFNVATSRAKLCTLIITDESHKNMNYYGEVGRFWRTI